MQFQKKIYLLSAVSMAISALFVIFLALPFFKKIQNNSVEITRQKEKLLSFQQETEAMENFKPRYEKVKKDLAKVDNLLVDSDLPLDFFIFLEKNSSEFSLDMEISSSESGELVLGWRTSSFQITIDGEYSKFLGFLEKIQNSPYLIQIQTLGVSKFLNSQSKAGSEDIKANLSLRVFTN